MLNHRPYQYLKNGKVQSAPLLIHAIGGMVIVAMLIFIVIMLASVFQPAADPPINDRAPALERIGVAK